MQQKFDFNDITLVPETLSKISSRNQVSVLNEELTLPLFTAPMDTVLNRQNYLYFKNVGINICLPRGEAVWDTDCFESYSLEDFEIFLKAYETKYYDESKKIRILIDVANGHMKRLYELSKRFCEIRYSDRHELMVGNIANPKTYEEYAKIEVNYIRVGIGGGSACLTSANTGVHYPMGSLISECYEIKKNNDYKTKIIADGGFRNFDDIIKALALGADFVMVGGILNKMLESCSDVKLFKFLKLNPTLAYVLWDEYPFLRKYMYKSFRGMSTKEVQKSWNKKKLTTSEGITKYNKVEYRLYKWVDNFKDYLKSAMSYTNSRTLEQFKETEYIFITENSLHRFKK